MRDIELVGDGASVFSMINDSLAGLRVMEEARRNLTIALEEYAGYVRFDGRQLLVDVDRGRGGVYFVVVVLDRGYGEAEARLIAERLIPLLREWGIEDLVIMRGESNATYEELEGLIVSMNHALRKQPLGSGAPEIVKRYRSMMENEEEPSDTVFRVFYTMAITDTGRVDVYIHGIRPTQGEAIEFVRWVRDAVGYCNVPIHFIFTGAKPPTATLPMEVRSHTITVSKASAMEKPSRTNTIPDATHRNEAGDTSDAPTRGPATSGLNEARRRPVQVLAVLMLLPFIMAAFLLGYYRNH
ncbi:MAG: hypothetical protein GSR84_02700 [Desulfurococcales archaeon]|nr:hypothetical protein [Desulfurococcales archaeon]